MNFRKRFNPESSGFPMAPMIDVVFLLLCFFITTQIFSQWETEIDVTLPTASSGEAPQRLPGDIIINITAEGETSINQRILDSAQLAALLRDVAEINRDFPPPVIKLRADKAAPYEHVINVLDLCRQADLWNIAFATGVPE